jgi:hypothetical protein
MKSPLPDRTREGARRRKEKARNGRDQKELKRNALSLIGLGPIREATL